MPPLSSDRITAHAEFYFPDGNIILVAGTDLTLAFRLHRGIVNRWSSVFNEMIDALESQPDPWTYLGCNAIVFDDDSVDFERLIKVLYDGTASVDCSCANFPLLASLIKLSHKYNIPHLQTHTLSHLLDAYPLNLPGWDMREAYSFSHTSRHNRLGAVRAHRPHPLAVASLALQLGAPNLLVPAYLDLARLPVSEIIRGYTLPPTNRPSSDEDTDGLPPPTISTVHLPIIQTTAVLRGKETLQRFIADFIKASVENRTQSPLCRYLQVPADPLGTPLYPCSMAFARVSHEMLVMTTGVAGGVDSDPLFVLRCAVEMLKEASQDVHHKAELARQDLGDSEDDDYLADHDFQPADQGKANDWDGKDCSGGACAACVEGFRQTVEGARQYVWNCLPKWFDLKKFIEQGFEAGWE